MSCWVYPGALAQPPDAVEFDPRDPEEWRGLLDDPVVVLPENKRNCLALCGAEYRKGATSREQSSTNLLTCHALVLDVDQWRLDRPPFTLEELRAKLAGWYAIVFTTFSSTAEQRFWRVVIPLEAPISPRRYRPLCRVLNEILDHTMSPSTFDPGRLGFCGGVGNEEGKKDYQWAIAKGEDLDPTQIDLDDEELTELFRATEPPSLARGEDWSSDAEALERAKRYYRRVGEDVEVGNRHEQLLRSACQLLWDWALPVEGAREVLRLVNGNFAEPKTDQDIETELEAAHERVLGLNRTEQPNPYGMKREPEERVTKTGLLDRAKTLLRAKSEADRRAGRVLRGLANGEAPSEPGAARVEVLEALDKAAATFSREKPERVLGLLELGVRAQRSRCGPQFPLPTDSELLAHLRHVYAVVRKKAEAAAVESKDARRAAILGATSGLRETPYAASELRAWGMAGDGATKNRWIVQHDRVYYVFVEGVYRGPYSKDAMVHYARKLLSPASDFLSLTKVGKDGFPSSRKLDELSEDYGTLVDYVQRSFAADKTTLDVPNRTLVQAVAPLRDLPAVFNAKVDGWLRSLAQGDEGKFKIINSWVAGLTLLDRPLVALHLCLPPDEGKSLLAYGLAKMWVEGVPTKLAKMQSDDFEKCPFVFCDDQIPAGPWRTDFSSSLRAFVSEASRPAKHCFSDRVTVVGYPRLLIATNNLFSYADSREHMSEADSRAAEDRIRLIQSKVNVAKRYLCNQAPEHKRWVDDDTIAKHALWLRDYYSLDHSLRFLVPPDGTATFDKAYTTGSNNQSFILEWVTAFIMSGVCTVPAVLADADGLYVSSTWMERRWSDHDPTRHGLRGRCMQLALAKVCDARVQVKLAGATDWMWYRRLDARQYEYWLEASAYEIDSVATAVASMAARTAFQVKVSGADATT